MIDFGDLRIDEDSPEGERTPNVIESRKRSIARSLQAMHDIVFSNEWDLFITVTFDPKKMDRFNYDEVVKKYSQKLKDIKRRKAPNLEYIFVPEEHKNGAYHFHGLLRNIEGLKVNDSGKKDKKGRTIFNLSDFDLGFNTATIVGENDKAAMYLMKYVTKDLKSSVMQARKRYWCTKGLDKTLKTAFMLNASEQNELISSLQKTKMTVSAKTATVEKDDYSNTITYIVYQDYSENQSDNEKAWANLVGSASSIVPYNEEFLKNSPITVDWE